ncbi:MAG TPA: hypothetical protein VF771_11285 [Longimicrobiaceae bacterium]
MNANPLRRRAAIFALVLLSACASAGQNASATGPARSAARPRTSVIVRNTAFSAYTIYAVAGVGERRRLGVVQPASSATFVIPAGMIVGTTSLRFIADPIGSDAVSSTYTLPVHEGDTLELTVR